MSMYFWSNLELQNKLMNLSMLNEEEFNSKERIDIYRDIIIEIINANKLYKRKSKKIRNSHTETPMVKIKRKK